MFVTSLPGTTVHPQALDQSPTGKERHSIYAMSLSSLIFWFKYTVSLFLLQASSILFSIRYYK